MPACPKLPKTSSLCQGKWTLQPPAGRAEAVIAIINLHRLLQRREGLPTKLCAAIGICGCAALLMSAAHQVYLSKCGEGGVHKCSHSL